MRAKFYSFIKTVTLKPSCPNLVEKTLPFKAKSEDQKGETVRPFGSRWPLIGSSSPPLTHSIMT